MKRDPLSFHWNFVGFFSVSRALAAVSVVRRNEFLWSFCIRLIVCSLAILRRVRRFNLFHLCAWYAMYARYYVPNMTANKSVTCIKIDLFSPDRILYAKHVCNVNVNIISSLIWISLVHVCARKKKRKTQFVSCLRWNKSKRNRLMMSMTMNRT